MLKDFKSEHLRIIMGNTLGRRENKEIQNLCVSRVISSSTKVESTKGRVTGKVSGGWIIEILNS